jgi:hypothetical protein
MFHSRLQKNMQTIRFNQGKTRRNWRLIGDISTARDGSNRKTNGCVWIIGTQSNNRTAALACHKRALFRSPDLNPNKRFFFGGKSKDKVCSNNQCTDGLKNNRDVLAHVVPQFQLRHFDVQWTICLLDVRCVCRPKEKISSAFFKYCILSKRIILTEIY